MADNTVGGFQTLEMSTSVTLAQECVRIATGSLLRELPRSWCSWDFLIGKIQKYSEKSDRYYERTILVRSDIFVEGEKLADAVRVPVRAVCKLIRTDNCWLSGNIRVWVGLSESNIRRGGFEVSVWCGVVSMAGEGDDFEEGKQSETPPEQIPFSYFPDKPVSKKILDPKNEYLHPLFSGGEEYVDSLSSINKEG